MRSLFLVFIVSVTTGCPTKSNPIFCADDNACDTANGFACNLDNPSFPMNQCVASCSDSTDCMAADAPICDPVSSVCRACEAGDTCPVQGQVCDRGQCVDVACADDSGCPASGPICDLDGGGCVACQDGDDDSVCSTYHSPLDYCVGGECVECIDASQCDNQACVDNACAPCTAHSQCTTGACDLASGGCVPEDRILFVDRDDLNADDATDCRTDVPCATIVRAVDVLLMEADRSIIVVRGTSDYEGYLDIPDAITVSLIGQGATIKPTVPATNNTPVINISGGSDVTIEGFTITGAAGATSDTQADGVNCSNSSVHLRDVTLSGNANNGLDATTCDLVVLERSRVTANLMGGVFIQGSGFRISNNFIVRNGSADSFFGGVSITNSQPVSDHVFDFNTIAQNTDGNNLVSGVQCTSNVTPFTATANIVYNGIGGDEVVSLGCNWTYSDIKMPNMDLYPGDGNINEDPKFRDPTPAALDYRLEDDTSPCVDRDGIDSVLCATGCVDIDGQERPYNLLYDIGADEYVP